ncbi:MAG: DNA alkylation repair protein [Muribaculaceae bacterium]|nr:DNA alkylation repair protein [Muribaculaceae bacterium]
MKRRFFAMRNGIVADTMRRSVPSYRMVFGLNLPQIAEIAADAPHTADFARQLWQDSGTRESLLMAPMLFPAKEMSADEALEWMASVRATEVADILCHRLLRHLPFAQALAMQTVDSASEMLRYTSLRLLRNLFPATATEESLAVARRELERGCSLTRPLSINIVDEIDFLLNEN